MGRSYRRDQMRQLGAPLATKRAEVEKLKEELRLTNKPKGAVRQLKAQLDAKSAEVKKLKNQLRACAPGPHSVQIQKGLGGSVSQCEVPFFPNLVKIILDLHAAKESMNAEDRALLKLMNGNTILQEWQSLKIADTLDLRVMQSPVLQMCPAIEVVTSGHKDGIQIGEFMRLNSRTGVVAQVGQDICPKADTEVALGSKVSVVLPDTSQKIFEIMTRDQADALKQVLEWNREHQGWRTNKSVDLGNGENQGCSDMILPAGSVLRGHPPHQVKYGVDCMVQPFCLDQVRVGTKLIFQCSPFEFAMSDLNVEKNQWNQTRIEVEGHRINHDLVPHPKQLGVAITTGDVFKRQEDALDIRKYTGLNALALQRANGRLELAPSSETLISKGCRLFFLKGHKEKIEAEAGGQITLNNMPVFE